LENRVNQWPELYLPNFKLSDTSKDLIYPKWFEGNWLVTSQDIINDSEEPVIYKVSFFKNDSDFIVSHNVEFDKKWFGRGRLPKLNKKWICSLEDINWSFQKSLKNRPSVTDLALSFSIPVWNLHRALSDCFYISEVFKKCDNLEELLLKATEPRFLYKALISYEDRSLAKNAGFRWNSPVQGAWSKKLTTDEAKNLDFSVEILN